MNEKELLRLKKQIEEARTKQSELKGQFKQIIQELKNTWECNGIEQANKLLVEKQKKLENIKFQIDEAVNKLEQQYGNILEE